VLPAKKGAQGMIAKHKLPYVIKKARNGAGEITLGLYPVAKRCTLQTDDGPRSGNKKIEDRVGPRFCLPSVDRRHPSSVGMGDARAFVPAAKAHRELMKRGSRACSPSSKCLALGIGADTLGELYWLPD
jgi:hypothetical protein